MIFSKPDWIAAIALSIQAVIFLIFLWWQDHILGKHAITLEDRTKIADDQAETMKKISETLGQQGKILAEQSTIMDEQVKFQRSVDARVEKGNLLNLVVDVRNILWGLTSVLSSLQESAPSQEERSDVAERFKSLAGAVTECQKAVLMAIHLSGTQRKYFSDYCQDMALDSTGNMVEDFKHVGALRLKYGGLAFLGELRNLTKSPEAAQSSERLFFLFGDAPSDRKLEQLTGETVPPPAAKLSNVPPGPQWGNVGNIFWLGGDLIWSAQLVLRGAPKGKILHGLRQSYHHISELGLTDSDPAKELASLKSGLESLQESALDRAWRSSFSEKIYAVTRMVNALLGEKQPSFRSNP